MSRGLLRNPWWVVFGAVLGLMVSNGPIMSFTVGMFIKPIAADLHWTRADVTSGLAISGFTSALSSPFLGRLMDRYGVKLVTLICVVLFGMSVASVGVVPETLPRFLGLYAIMGAISSGIAPLPYAKSIAGVFDAKRGLALGIAIAGVGLGVVFIPQYLQYMITWWGWRAAYVGLGVLHVAIAFPAVLFLLREPDQRVAAPGRVSGTLPGKTVQEALLRGGSFWVLVASFVLSAGALNSATTHIVPILTDAGVSSEFATTVLSMSGVALVIGRISSGWFADRMFAPHTAAIYVLIPLVGVALLGTTHIAALSFLGAFLIGIGFGGELNLMAFLVSRYFGLRSFGALYGILTGLYFLSSHNGPYLTDLLYEATHSYSMALMMDGGALLAAALLITRLGVYVYPVVRGTDDAVSAFPAPLALTPKG